MPADLDARARRFEREERAMWEEKYAKKKEENGKLRGKLDRVLKHLKLLETTLATQQQVLDRYQRELAAYRSGISIVPRDAMNIAPDNKRHSAANVSNDTEEKQPVKRAKRESVAQRHSLPLTDCPTPDESGHSSPSRRRSLPETDRRPTTRGVRGDNGGASDAWTTRKHDMDSRRTAPIKATLPRQSARPSSSRLNRYDNACYSDKKGTASDSTDEFLNDYDAAGSVDKKTNAVKVEPQRDERTPLQERSTHERSVQRRYQRRELPFKSHTSDTKMERHAHEERAEKENVFAYVEVVRNREERAAMPGHDCVECRKYYAALGGLVSEHEMKDKCSRHRARFEPYQTPDDFWRLSFPDSHPEASP